MKEVFKYAEVYAKRYIEKHPDVLQFLTDDEIHDIKLDVAIKIVEGNSYSNFKDIIPKLFKLRLNNLIQEKLIMESISYENLKENELIDNSFIEDVETNFLRKSFFQSINFSGEKYSIKKRNIEISLDNNDFNFKELGEKYNLSAARISQIVTQFKRKTKDNMRKTCWNKKEETFFDRDEFIRDLLPQ